MNKITHKDTFTRIGSNGLWCVRKQCNRFNSCQYIHNCKGMTLADSEIAVAQWEANRLIREEREAQEKLKEEMARRVRNNKIEAMLEAYNLSLYDLEEWVKEIKQ